MPPDPATPDASSGLLSSVFSFVSREVRTFVKSASGIHVEEESFEDDENSEYDNEAAEDLDARADLRSLGDKSRKERTSHSGISEVLDSSAVADTSIRTRTRHGHEKTYSPSVHSRSRRVPNDDYSEDELSGPEDANSPSPRPSARTLRRRPSVTMPGALYERSSSLEPSPDYDWERTRVVRFAPGIESPPAGRHSESLEHQENCEAGPSRPRYKGTPTRSDNERKSKNSKVLLAARRFSDDDPSRVSLMLPRSPDKIINKEYSPQLREKKRKKRQSVHTEDTSDCQTSEDDARPARGDVSYETRVRGKEKELLHAIEREKGREDDDERARDKERIKVLEEEVQKLREELEKRSSTSQQSSFAPPPPPPPPPLPSAAFSTRIPLNHSNQSQHEGLFMNARASLRPTALPSEPAINPAYAVPSAKRKGQPTINIGADKMADFLKEMKTHRLRKVGNLNQANMSLDSSTQPYKVQRPPPASRVRDIGGTVGNRSEVISEKVSDISFAIPYSKGRNDPCSRSLHVTEQDVNRGSDLKRKRQFELGDGSMSTLSIKRRILEPSLTLPKNTRNVQSLDARNTLGSNSSISGIPIFSRRENNSSSSVTDSIGSHSRWSSAISKSGTDFTTPSLCSDTEQGDEPSLEDRPPATPPLTHSQGRSRSVSVDSFRVHEEGKSRTHGRILDNDGQDQTEQGDMRIMTGERITSESTTELQGANRLLRVPGNLFASRPPSSPIPIDSPKKPRPPARTKVKQTHHPYHEIEEEEDPLALSFRAPLQEISAYEDETLETQDDCQLSNGKRLSRSAEGSLGVVQPSTHKDKYQTLSTVTRVPTARHRRDTLDAELRRVDSEYSAYDHEFANDVFDNALQAESGTLTGVGLRSEKEGFIAHGGAGGIPVVMGPDHVEGHTYEASEEFAKRPHSNGRRKPTAVTGKRKGRTRN